MIYDYRLYACPPLLLLPPIAALPLVIAALHLALDPLEARGSKGRKTPLIGFHRRSVT